MNRYDNAKTKAKMALVARALENIGIDMQAMGDYRSFIMEVRRYVDGKVDIAHPVNRANEIARANPDVRLQPKSTITTVKITQND